MTSIAKGANLPIDAAGVRAVLSWDAAPGVPDVDASALALQADGRVASDDDFIFYNQPQHPTGAIRHLGKRGNADALDVDLSALPANVERVVLAASADGGTFGQVPGLRLTVSDLAGGAAIAQYDMTAAEETAIVAGELYRRGGAWKFRAVGQGYASGLAGIATDFGISVGEPEPAAPPAGQAPPPPAAQAPPPPAAQAPPPPAPATPAPPAQAPPAQPPAAQDPAPPAPAPAPAPSAGGSGFSLTAPSQPAATASSPAQGFSLSAPPQDAPSAAATPPPPQFQPPPPQSQAPSQQSQPPPQQSQPPPQQFQPPPQQSQPPPQQFQPPPQASAPPSQPAGPPTLDGGKVSLVKGARVSLVKRGAPLLSRVTMGLGWDPARHARNVDLDASVIAYDAGGTEREVVYFGHKKGFKGAIRHGGDNLTGKGSGDDETIDVDLTALPPDVTTLIFTITSYGGQRFTDVANAFSRLIDATTREELARYNLSEAQPATAVLMTMLRRVPAGTWEMRALGEFMDAKTGKQLVGPAAHFARQP